MSLYLASGRPEVVEPPQKLVAEQRAFSFSRVFGLGERSLQRGIDGRPEVVFGLRRRLQTAGTDERLERRAIRDSE